MKERGIKIKEMRGEKKRAFIPSYMLKEGLRKEHAEIWKETKKSAAGITIGTFIYAKGISGLLSSEPSAIDFGTGLAGASGIAYGIRELSDADDYKKPFYKEILSHLKNGKVENIFRKEFRKHPDVEKLKKMIGEEDNIFKVKFTRKGIKITTRSIKSIIEKL